MDFVIICGPPASGKMTVGQALKERTGYKLLHNHMSLELVHQFFDFGTEHFKKLDKAIRFSIFEEVAKSDIKGLIFTMVWAFSEKEDEDYIDEIIAVFNGRDLRVCIVELDCNLEERLKRNRHENRLLQKPSKRDVEASEKRLLHHDQKYRMNSLENELSNKSIFKIQNTHLSATDVAIKIVDHYRII